MGLVGYTLGSSESGLLLRELFKIRRAQAVLDGGYLPRTACLPHRSFQGLQQQCFSIA